MNANISLLRLASQGAATQIATFEVQEESLDRPDEAIFAVRHDGQVAPVNEVAAVLANDWSDQDITTFAESVIESDRQGRPTIDELIIGNPATPLRLQIMTLRLCAELGLICFVRNISLDREFYLALADSRRRYRDFAELTDALQWETTLDGRFAYVSPRGGFGFSAEELLDLDPRNLLAECGEDQSNPFATSVRIERRDIWLWRRNGQIAAVEFSARPLYSADGSWIGARGVCRDISDLRASQSSGSQAQWQLDAIIGLARVLEVEGGRGLAPFGEAIRSAFGADGAQISLRDQASPASAWTVLSQAGMTEGRTDRMAEIMERIDAAGTPAVTAISHSSWRILALAFKLPGEARGAVTLWRRSNLGPWASDHCALLESIGPLVRLQVQRQQGLREQRPPPARESGGYDIIQIANAIGRRLKRSLFAGYESCLISIDVEAMHSLRGEKVGPRSPAPMAGEMLETMVRGSDLVIEISGTRVCVWLDQISEATARTRADGMATELKARFAEPFGGERRIEVMSNVISISAQDGARIDKVIADLWTTPCPNMEQDPGHVDGGKQTEDADQ